MESLRAFRAVLHCIALHSTAPQGKAVQGKAMHGKATWKAFGLSGLFWPKCTAWQRKAWQCIATQRNAKQRGKPSGFPGCFGLKFKERIVSIRIANIKVTGAVALLLNNPQTVDRFNPYSRHMAEINAKKTRRTDDDYLELRELEIESKTYFDDQVGVYVPSSWVSEALACNGFKVAKLSRDVMRGALFTTAGKLPLAYRDQDKVQGLADVVKNADFHLYMGIPQGKVRILKAFPIFHKWSFTAKVEFDDKVIDPGSLTRIAEYAGKYGGFGDFRPRFGRATVEVEHV